MDADARGLRTQRRRYEKIDLKTRVTVEVDRILSPGVGLKTGSLAALMAIVVCASRSPSPCWPYTSLASRVERRESGDVTTKC